MVRYKLLIILLILTASGIVFVMLGGNRQQDNQATNTNTRSSVLETLNPTPTPTLPPIPNSKILQSDYHVFQRFNNCGPASLSMALYYFGINESQEKLGNDLRPYQIGSGDNDDKSVTLEELAEKAEEYGLLPYHRPSGNIEILKQFVANGIPVITRTLTKTTEDIGHYRVVRGYDEPTKELIQDDSLQGKNLRYSYTAFNQLWDDFNYEYLALVPQEKKQLAEQILGEDVDPKIAWQKAVDTSKAQLATNPNNITARFNLSVAYYNIGEYQKSIEEFEKVENRLSFRTLWYQIEPILAYYETGNFDRVFEITNGILNNHNRAFSELYIIRGNIYRNQGQIDLARSEYEKAIFYNQNLASAHEALGSVN